MANHWNGFEGYCSSQPTACCFYILGFFTLGRAFSSGSCCLSHYPQDTTAGDLTLPHIDPQDVAAAAPAYPAVTPPSMRSLLEALLAIASCSLTTTFLLWTLPILCLLVVVVGLQGALGPPQVLFSKLLLPSIALFSTGTGWNALGSSRTPT